MRKCWLTVNEYHVNVILESGTGPVLGEPQLDLYIMAS